MPNRNLRVRILLNSDFKFRNCPAAGYTSAANTISRDIVTFTAKPGLLYDVTLIMLIIDTKICCVHIVIFHVFISVDSFFMSSSLPSCALPLGCCVNYYYYLKSILLLFELTWIHSCLTSFQRAWEFVLRPSKILIGLCKRRVLVCT